MVYKHTVEAREKISIARRKQRYLEFRKLTEQMDKDDIEKMKLWRKTFVLPVKDSSIELKIQNLLKQLNIEFFTHQYIKEIEHGYQCDILIPSLNLVIECDGDYWHKYPIGKEIDHIRTKELIENGFKVLRLWEFEINNMSVEELNRRINDASD